MAPYSGNVPRRRADLKRKERGNVTGYFHSPLARYRPSLCFCCEIRAPRVEGGMGIDYFIDKSVTLSSAGPPSTAVQQCPLLTEPCKAQTC